MGKKKFECTERMRLARDMMGMKRHTAMVHGDVYTLEEGDPDVQRFVEVGSFVEPGKAKETKAAADKADKKAAAAARRKAAAAARKKGGKK